MKPEFERFLFRLGSLGSRKSNNVVMIKYVCWYQDDHDKLQTCVSRCVFSEQLFVLSNSLMVSLVELPALEVPGGGITAGLRTAPSQVRIILRDLSGKASWDASILYCSPEDSMCSHQLANEERGVFRNFNCLQSYINILGTDLVFIY
jgi:hypothetical protein